jgi:hypothetical protein
VDICHDDKEKARQGMQWLLEHAQLRNRNWLHEQATRTASQNVEAIARMEEKVCVAACQYCEPDSMRQPVDQEEGPLLAATGCKEKQREKTHDIVRLRKLVAD